MPIALNLVRTAEIVVKATLLSLGGVAIPVSNVFYYRRTSVAVSPVKASLATIFETNVLTPLVAASHERLTGISQNIRWLEDAENPTMTISSALVGAIATDSLPPNATVYVLMQTALRGKKYRGSKHFAAVPEIHTTGDVLTGGGLTLWQAVRDALAASCTDADGNIWKPCILSRKLSQVKTNPTTVVTNDVTTVVLNKNIANMKRRRIKRVI